MSIFIYHPRYELKWGGHVFPVEKYRLLHDRLIAEGLVAAEEFLVPEPATDDELLLVHSQAYLQRLEELVDRPQVAIAEFEAPYPREVADAVRYARAARSSPASGHWPAAPPPSTSAAASTTPSRPRRGLLLPQRRCRRHPRRPGREPRPPHRRD